jgi:phosphohistidine swiveling domain-containing protein
MIEEFLKKEWISSYARKMSYQKIRFYRYGWWKGSTDRFGYKLSYELGRMKDGNFLGYLSREEADGLKNHLEFKLRKPKFVRNVIKGLGEKIDTQFKDYVRFVKSIPKDFSTFTNKDLISLLHKCYKEDEPTSTNCWNLFDVIEIPLINSANRLLVESGQTQEEADDLLQRLSKPSKITPIDSERVSLLKLALENRKDYYVALEKHVEEFAYMPMYDMYYEPYTTDYFEKRCKDVTSSYSSTEIKKEIEDITGRYERYKEDSEKIIDRFNKNDTLKFLLEFFVRYSYLKDWKPYTRDQGSFHYKRLFGEIAKRLNLTLYRTLFLDAQELEDSLLGKVVIAADELDARSKDSVYFCKDATIVCSHDKGTVARVDALLAPQEDKKEIAGTKAFAGKARGVVSLVLSNADFNKFKMGNILVTSATRPDFVPIMKQASAIVTDEGGILSHAAIISRELKIPCIVGTRDATKLLKDGDLVEVDAERGTVNIVERK